MSRYLVIHQADYDKLASMDHMIDLAREVAHQLGPDVKWMNSWWSSGDETLICEWDTPDRETLDRFLGEVMDAWPVVKVYDVLWSDPRWWAGDADDEGK
jgi:hypothetical protein